MKTAILIIMLVQDYSRGPVAIDHIGMASVAVCEAAVEVIKANPPDNVSGKVTAFCVVDE